MQETKEKNEQVKIIIPLQPVTKKNSGRIVGLGRKCPACNQAPKRILLPSKTYEEYEKQAGKFLHPLGFHMDFPVNVKCLFYMKTKRAVDLTNLLEAVDDVLVKYGILPDDNNQIIAGHDGSRVRYSKEFPRTEIIITKMEEEDDEYWRCDSSHRS